jgi:hypothetical protein
VHAEGLGATVGLAALRACVRLPAAVREHVRAEGLGAAEGLAALRACVRLLPGVDPRVLADRIGAQEGLPAHGARVRLLPAVRARVHAEVGRPAEGLAALCTLVRLVAGVNPAVPVQGRRVSEQAAALTALVAPASIGGRLAQLSIQGPGQGTAAPVPPAPPTEVPRHVNSAETGSKLPAACVSHLLIVINGSYKCSLTVASRFELRALHVLGRHSST